MIDFHIQVEAAHVGQVDMIIWVFHEPFTVALIVEPEIVELAWVELLQLLFGGDVLGFFLSKEDVLFVELIHIQIVSFLLHLTALRLLLVAWTIILVLLHWLDLFRIRFLVFILLLWRLLSTYKDIIGNRALLDFLRSWLVLLCNLDVNAIFDFDSTFLSIFFRNGFMLLNRILLFYFLFLLLYIEVPQLGLQLNVSLLA